MPDKISSSKIVLGWETTQTLEPRYWVETSNPNPGDQHTEDLFQIDGEKVAKHTCIIAQSGSGKSYFLGRLIEEIILKTKSRCVILDPNSDFRKINEVKSIDTWIPKYDIVKSMGFLVHEKKREEFSELWSNMAINIISGKEIVSSKKVFKSFKVNWPSISIEFLADELNPKDKADFKLVHQFVQDVEKMILGGTIKAERETTNLLNAAQKLLEDSFEFKGSNEFKVFLDENYGKRAKSNLSRTVTNIFKEFQKGVSIESDFGSIKFDGRKTQTNSDRIKSIMRGRLNDAIINIHEAYKYINPEISRLYFSRAFEYDKAGMLNDGISDPKTVDIEDFLRIKVVDLPSFENSNYRNMVINSIIEEEWKRCRTNWEKALSLKDPKSDNRFPTFIVIDEAHNLIPKDARDKTSQVLREQFLKIIAEGRKFGLFLIVVTQRPDKIDPMVLSECENYALLKLSSDKTISLARNLLDLEDVNSKKLMKCLEFKKGRVLLAGSWAPLGGHIFITGARRSIEGGRDLEKNNWAIPVPEIKLPAPDLGGGLAK